MRRFILIIALPLSAMLLQKRFESRAQGGKLPESSRPALNSNKGSGKQKPGAHSLFPASSIFIFRKHLSAMGAKEPVQGKIAGLKPLA